MIRLCAGNAVLRVPILYGPVEFTSESAVTILYDKVKDTSKPCIMDHRQRRFPTHTCSVADVVKQMILKHSKAVCEFCCSRPTVLSIQSDYV